MEEFTSVLWRTNMERSFMGRSWKSSLLVSHNGSFSQIILLIRATEFLDLSTRVYGGIYSAGGSPAMD